MSLHAKKHIPFGLLHLPIPLCNQCSTNGIYSYWRRRRKRRFPKRGWRFSRSRDLSESAGEVLSVHRTSHLDGKCPNVHTFSCDSLLLLSQTFVMALACLSEERQNENAWKNRGEEKRGMYYVNIGPQIWSARIGEGGFLWP